jgi:fatty-acyl-CoA synthase
MNLPLTPVRCLYRGVDLFGKKVGVVSGPSRYTYVEFGERCERVAAGLRSEGVAAGDRVAYLSFNSNQLLEGYYGPLLIRAISMPLNVRLTAAELVDILNHATPKVLFFEEDFAPLIEVFRRRCPAVGRFVSLDKSTPVGDISYEELLSRGRIDRPEISSFNENETAELFYTSGSTGTPKGVMLSHRNLYLHALSMAGTIYAEDDAVSLHTIPLFHANGWGSAQVCTMLGNKQVMVRRFDPALVLRLIQEEKATSMTLVPVMANALLTCPELGKFDTSSMRRIMLGGAASSPVLLQRLERAFGGEIFGGYGLTETSPVVSCSRRKSTVKFASEEDRLFRKAMAGWPVLCNEVRVVDLNMKDVPRDMLTVGEVVVRGDNIMDGYYREPEATRAVMTGEWFHTGDMAVWDEENFVHIVDRKKDLIISGGENISSLEVERAILAHPAVLECAVVAAPDEKWGEVPAAFIALRVGEALSADTLLRFLEPRIAKFKLPRVVQFVDGQLPKTGTGKVFKRQLREPLWERKTNRVQGA